MDRPEEDDGSWLATKKTLIAMAIAAICLISLLIMNFERL